MRADNVTLIFNRNEIRSDPRSIQGIDDRKGFDFLESGRKQDSDAIRRRQGIRRWHFSSSGAQPGLVPGTLYTFRVTQARARRARSYSERRASTGSWRDALEAGIKPATTVKPTEIATNTTAVSGESWAMFFTWNPCSAIALTRPQIP